MMKYKKYASIITATLLSIAIFDLPYGYYNFLRIAVTSSAVYLAWIAHNVENNLWLFVMGAVALLFNPIAPVYLDKGTWVVIDLVTAALFLMSVYFLKGK